jgi:hypothetical protein
MKLTEKEWNLDVTKHFTKYTQLKNIEVIDVKEMDFLLENNYYFWIVVKNENPYFHKDCYLVDLYLHYTNKPISIYVNKEYLNMITDQESETIEETETLVTETSYAVGNTSFNTLHESQGYCDNNDFDYDLIQTIGEINNNKQIEVTPIYWYEYTLRGFSLGCQPKGFIEHDPTIGRHGIIAYDRLLTDSELDEYELKLHHASYKAA